MFAGLKCPLLQRLLTCKLDEIRYFCYGGYSEHSIYEHSVSELAVYESIQGRSTYTDIFVQFLEPILPSSYLTKWSAAF